MGRTRFLVEIQLSNFRWKETNSERSLGIYSYFRYEQRWHDQLVKRHAAGLEHGPHQLTDHVCRTQMCLQRMCVETLPILRFLRLGVELWILLKLWNLRLFRFIFLQQSKRADSAIRRHEWEIHFDLRRLIPGGDCCSYCILHSDSDLKSYPLSRFKPLT